MTPESFMKIAIGLVALQCLALMGGVGWLASRPTTTEKSASVAMSSWVATQPDRSPVVASSAKSPSKASPPKPRPPNQVPMYDTQQEAVAEYMQQLDHSIDMDMIFTQKVALSEVEARHRAALRCTKINCEALSAYKEIIRGAGRRVPPPPRWKGQDTSTARKDLVDEYIKQVENQLELSMVGADRPDLLPDKALVENARACDNFQCLAMDVYLKTAGAALQELGQELPPQPPLPDEGPR